VAETPRIEGQIIPSSPRDSAFASALSAQRGVLPGTPVRQRVVSGRHGLVPRGRRAGSLTDSIIMPIDDYRRIASIEEVIDVARDD
jgi:hypothetical protein